MTSFQFCPGFYGDNEIVVLPVGTANARFMQKKLGYNMLGKFI